jgi:ATP-dependent Clp protease ATP-binding subunit ClpA
LDAAQLEEIARSRLPELAAHHDVQMPESLIQTAIEPPRPGDARSHPGLMLDRLDQAALRSRIRRADVVEPRDFALGADGSRWPRVDADDLAARIKEHVRGQAHAIESIAARLALTSAKLDLRPERPNGVFLLVGPTGVGKTALAKALSSELFGPTHPLIRLDMSEYAEDWSVSRLYGPHPGYIGSDRPEGWFTSRVLKAPVSLILLDEMEKAHPDVWNAFLQVFDEGRMTDSRGRVADFGDSIILMTSNLGARAYSANALGFSASQEAVAHDAEVEMLAAVKQSMAPEFINRIDEIITLKPLTREVIAEIATIEIRTAFDRLALHGWELELTPAAADFLVDEGFDPIYGARHLQRNIERYVMQQLVDLEPASHVGDLVEGAIVWEPVPENR